MTNPSITYGHGYLTDCADTTDWTEDLSPTLSSTALTVLYNDYFKLTGTAGAANRSTYWMYDISDISSTVYPKFMIRWKTSAESTGLGAKLLVDYSTNLSNVETLMDVSFNTTWQVTTGDLTAGKTVKRVLLYAVSDAACEGEYVLYDFLLLHKGTFTFPNVAYGLNFTSPPRYAIIGIPSRVSDITQNLGSESATVTCSCDLDIGDDWKRPQGETEKTDVVNGEVFYEIAHRSYTEAFQWLNTGEEQFKVTLESPVVRRSVSGTQAEHILDLTFREYRRSSASNETYIERFGLNL